MKPGICVPHYGRSIEVGRILEVVRNAEERGLDSVWVTDHVVVPRQTNVIYREQMLDPLAVLPWLVGVTRRIALGTSVVILRRVARLGGRLARDRDESRRVSTGGRGGGPLLEGGAPRRGSGAFAADPDSDRRGPSSCGGDDRHPRREGPAAADGLSP